MKSKARQVAGEHFAEAAGMKVDIGDAARRTQRLGTRDVRGIEVARVELARRMRRGEDEARDALAAAELAVGERPVEAAAARNR